MLAYMEFDSPRSSLCSYSELAPSRSFVTSCDVMFARAVKPEKTPRGVPIIGVANGTHSSFTFRQGLFFVLMRFMLGGIESACTDIRIRKE